MPPPTNDAESDSTEDRVVGMLFPLSHDELYHQFMLETQGEGLWKRKTLPSVLPSVLDLAKLKTAQTPELPSSPPSNHEQSPGPASPWTAGRILSRKNSGLGWRKASRASIFSASGDSSKTGVKSVKSVLAPSEDSSSHDSGRPTRKFLYSLAAFSMQNRRASSDSHKGRRESGPGISRLLGLAGSSSIRRGSAAVDKTPFGGVSKIASLANLMGLRHKAHIRLKEAKSKIMWRKVRLWCGIINLLSKLLRKHSAFAINDPSSPFYSGHMSGSGASSRPLDDILDEAVDKDHYMFFDPSQFKANRQRRMSQEVQRILTKPSEERTPEEIHFAMIGLRGIPQLAIFPVRMQRNLAQYGEFQCFEAKRMILKQGHPPHGYYIILYGNVVVAVKNEETGFAKIVVELPRGETFGDLAIVNGTPRNSSVLTTTYTELLLISKSVYETIFMTGGPRNINDPDQHDFLSSLQFLRDWPLQKLFDKDSEKFVRFMYIQRNGVIMRDSNCNNWLIVVKSGSVKVLKKLIRTKPTVSKRSGLYRDKSCTTAFQTFVTDSREYARWLASRSVNLPAPLEVEDSSAGEEEVEEEQDVEEVEEDYLQYEDEYVAEEEEGEEEEHDGTLEEVEEEEEEREVRKTNPRRKMGNAGPTAIRPHTYVKGMENHRHHPPQTRKAWSAKHPASTSSIKFSFLPKKTKLTKLKLRFEMEYCSLPQQQTDVPQEAKFAAAKRTILDDLDAAYLSKTRLITEADLRPQFVHVHTLTKGDVFGLAALVFPDQPSLCLVSNGAECMLIDKRFYLNNCPVELSRRLKTEVSPYPSDVKLQEDLINRINWDVYKQVVKRQVYEQSSTRVTVTPL